MPNMQRMPVNGRPTLAPTGGRHAAGLYNGIFVCDLHFSGERLLLWLPVFRKIKMKCLNISGILFICEGKRWTDARGGLLMNGVDGSNTQISPQQ